MTDLAAGTVVQWGSRKGTTHETCVVLRSGGGSVACFFPGNRSFKYGIAAVLRVEEVLARPGSGAWEYVRVIGERIPHGLLTEPIREHDALLADVSPAVFRYFDAILPGSAAELRDAPLRETYFHTGDFTRGRMAVTGSGLKIEAELHEFEMRDMVQMDRDWRWYALFRPIVVVGVYLGDGGNQIQILSEEPPSAAALSGLYRDLRAR